MNVEEKVEVKASVNDPENSNYSRARHSIGVLTRWWLAKT